MKLPRPEIVVRIGEVIARELKVGVELIVAGATLRGDLDADSLDMYELVIDLEEEFGIELKEESLQEAAQKEGLDDDVTVGTLIDLIERALESPDKTA